MSNIVITKNSTKEERLAVIKAVAQKIAKRKAFQARMAAGAARVRKWTDEVEAPRRKSKEDAFNAMIDKMDENHNHYQDGAKYLAEHYGDRAADQRSYEADWN